MSRYLFFIRQPYSFEILRPLQDAIRNRRDEVAWFLQGVDARHLRSEARLLSTVSDAKAYAPLAVFAPGKWVPDFFPGHKVQVFHGLANDDTGKKGHFRIRDVFDLYCTHGESGTTAFQQLARRYGTFHVTETGWPKVDPLFLPGRVADLRERLRTAKPIVLYAATFSPSLTSAPKLAEAIGRLSKLEKCYRLR